jgi:hypothetical protein
MPDKADGPSACNSRDARDAGSSDSGIANLDGTEACIAPPGPAFGMPGAAGRGADALECSALAHVQNASPKGDQARPKIIQGEGLGGVEEEEEGEEDCEDDEIEDRAGCCSKAASGDGSGRPKVEAGLCQSAGAAVSSGRGLVTHPPLSSATVGGSGGCDGFGLSDVRPMSGLGDDVQGWALTHRGPTGGGGGTSAVGRAGSSRLPGLIEAIAMEGRALRWDACARWYEVINGPLFEERCAGPMSQPLITSARCLMIRRKSQGEVRRAMLSPHRVDLSGDERERSITVRLH